MSGDHSGQWVMKGRKKRPRSGAARALTWLARLVEEPLRRNRLEKLASRLDSPPGKYE